MAAKLADLTNADQQLLAEKFLRDATESESLSN
jgi:hypothetical protein